MFEKLAERVNADAGLVRRGRLFSGTVLLACGGEEYCVAIAAGRVESVARGARPLQARVFAVRASADAWQRFREPVPEAGWHDILAMTSGGRATVEGDIAAFMRHLRYFKDMLAVLRDGG